MKKLLIAALVGGFILFAWQSLSWSMMDVHASEMSYTSQQDEILKTMADVGLPEGTYFLPTAPPGSSFEVQTAVQERAIGKPWARISYHDQFEMDMGSRLFRGYTVNFLVVILLAWVLLKFEDLDFSSALIASLCVGAIGYFTFPYLENIWFSEGTMGYLIDTVVQWSLVGAWLGWYLPR
jgi:hypothetical protein